MQRLNLFVYRFMAFIQTVLRVFTLKTVILCLVCVFVAYIPILVVVMFPPFKGEQQQKGCIDVMTNHNREKGCNQTEVLSQRMLTKRSQLNRSGHKQEDIEL